MISQTTFPSAARWSFNMRWLEPTTMFLFVVSVFLLPPFKLHPALPSFYLSDLLLPVMGFIVTQRRSWKFQHTPYVPFLLVYAGYIFVTIVINNRIDQRSDYFEILKALKLAVATLFVFGSAERVDILRMLKAVFIALVVFNLFQYTGWWGFNQIIEPYYSNAIQLDGFGLNSIGQPDTRRMLGTMGNPNDNAILFLFFFVIFMPKRNDTFENHAFFLLAFLGGLFSQSRTGAIALVVVYGVGAALTRFNLRVIAVHAAVFIAFYICFAKLDASVQADVVHEQYVGTLVQPGMVVETRSVQGRFEIWTMMWEMIKEKPLFGHGPNKEFFYAQNLHPDGEYVLMLWRYGVVGFAFYLGSIWLPVFFRRNIYKTEQGRRMLLFGIVLAITAVTNVPMNKPNVLMMLALMTGLGLAVRFESSEQSVEEIKPQPSLPKILKADLN
jgi:O-antigen ligase